MNRNHILPKAFLATALMLVLNLGIAGAKVSGSSNETSEGTLTKGYVYSFTTLGENRDTVHVEVKLLDEKEGVVVPYLQDWTYGDPGLDELPMVYNEETKVATVDVTGYSDGAVVTFRIKWVFAGGMAVSKDLEYVLGEYKYDDRAEVNSGETFALTAGKTYTGAPGDAVKGGVVFNNGGTVTGTDVIFAYTKVYNGGAIYNFASSVVKLAGDVVFEMNKASNRGGAIDDWGTTVFDGSVEFHGNKADGNGGAYYSYGSTLAVYGAASFSENKAEGDFGYGGAINAGSSTLDFRDKVTFTDNTAAKEGGAAFLNNGSHMAVAKDATFSGNKAADGNGGAVYVGKYSKLTLGGNATFNGNSASKAGGAIYSNGTVNFAGVVDLQTGTDTWVNEGYVRDGVQYATVNWDLSGGLGKYATIKNFQRYSNKETNGSYLVKQTITVNADDKVGDEYVLATGDMTGYLTDKTGKYVFYLTGVDGQNGPEGPVTVGGVAIKYNGKDYKVWIDENGTADNTDDKLVFGVPDGNLTLTVGSTGYATIYSESNLQIPEGVTVLDYSYDKAGQYFKMENSFTSGIIAGKKGYVIMAAPGKYSFIASEEKAQECKSCLKGRTSNVDTAAMGAKPVYVFDVVDGKPGFYKFSGILRAEKAYYQEEDN